MKCSIAGLLVLLTATSVAEADVRTWIGSKGKYTIDAELVEVKEGSVRLKKADNRLVWVPLARLSLADRGYVKVWQKHHGQADGQDEPRLVVEVHPVQDLIPRGDIDTLAYLCETLVAPNSWEDMGGPGSLSFLGGKMTLRQTSAVQQDVASLLAALRQLPRFRAPVRIAPLIPQIHVGQGSGTGDKQMQIVVYPVADLFSRNGVDADVIEEHLTTTVEPSSWDFVGGPASIGWYADRGALIISNTKQAHGQIVDLLAKLRQPGGRSSRR